MASGVDEDVGRPSQIKAAFDALESNNARLKLLSQEYIHDPIARVLLYKHRTRDRVVFRDGTNKRKQTAVAQKYAVRFLHDGFSVGLTGKPWLVRADPSGSKLGALSWGTRIVDVFYPIVEANDERVNNEHVQTFYGMASTSASSGRRCFHNGRGAGLRSSTTPSTAAPASRLRNVSTTPCC